MYLGIVFTRVIVAEIVAHPNNTTVNRRLLSPTQTRLLPGRVLE